jgi:hypothetical protein
MMLPTLKQLERALHLREALETVQRELSAVLSSLAEAVAPEPHNTGEREPTRPFADSPGGAREQRLQMRRQERRTRKRRKRRQASKVRRPARQPQPEESPHPARLWNLLSGGEVGEEEQAERGRRKPKGKR